MFSNRNYYVTLWPAPRNLRGTAIATERNKLPTYVGDRFYCDSCQERFRDGDLIVIFGSFVFCYPLEFGSQNDCYKRWMKKHRINDFEFDTMKYHGNT